MAVRSPGRSATSPRKRKPGAPGRYYRPPRLQLFFQGDMRTKLGRPFPNLEITESEHPEPGEWREGTFQAFIPSLAFFKQFHEHPRTSIRDVLAKSNSDPLRRFRVKGVEPESRQLEDDLDDVVEDPFRALKLRHGIVKKDVDEDGDRVVPLWEQYYERLKNAEIDLRASVRPPTPDKGPFDIEISYAFQPPEKRRVYDAEKAALYGDAYSTEEESSGSECEEESDEEEYDPSDGYAGSEEDGGEKLSQRIRTPSMKLEAPIKPASDAKSSTPKTPSTRKRVDRSGLDSRESARTVATDVLTENATAPKKDAAKPRRYRRRSMKDEKARKDKKAPEPILTKEILKAMNELAMSDQESFKDNLAPVPMEIPGEPYRIKMLPMLCMGARGTESARRCAKREARLVTKAAKMQTQFQKYAMDEKEMLKFNKKIDSKVKKFNDLSVVLEKAGQENVNRRVIGALKRQPDLAVDCSKEEAEFQIKMAKKEEERLTKLLDLDPDNEKLQEKLDRIENKLSEWQAVQARCNRLLIKKAS